MITQGDYTGKRRQPVVLAFNGLFFTEIGALFMYMTATIATLQHEGIRISSYRYLIAN